MTVGRWKKERSENGRRREGSERRVDDIAYLNVRSTREMSACLLSTLHKEVREFNK